MQLLFKRLIEENTYGLSPCEEVLSWKFNEDILTSETKICGIVNHKPKFTYFHLSE